MGFCIISVVHGHKNHNLSFTVVFLFASLMGFIVFNSRMVQQEYINLINKQMLTIISEPETLDGVSVIKPGFMSGSFFDKKYSDHSFLFS